MGHKDVSLWLWNYIQKGKQNIVADVVSRKEEGTNGLLCSISIPQSDLVGEARIEWQQDENLWNIIQHL